MPITTSLATQIGQVRADLGDDTEAVGVLPGNANLSDDLISHLLTREVSVGRAVAGAAELIARRWAKAISISAGPLRQEMQQIYDHWAKEAASLRAQYGYSAGFTGIAAGGGGFSVTPARQDGYTPADSGYEYARWPEHDL
jgi:hypothetical protein